MTTQENTYTDRRGRKVITVSKPQPQKAPIEEVPGYCIVRVEELDQAEASQRTNTWRYSGPDGLPYRTRASFETGFRVRLQDLGGTWSDAHLRRDSHWFNAVQPGGDPDLTDFMSWARIVADTGLVHPDDVTAWRSTFVDVEGGGRGKYLVSTADSTWRTIMFWIASPQLQPKTVVHPDPGENGKDQEPQHADPTRLSLASFGNHLVRHEPITDFAKMWARKLPMPRAWLVVIVADVWRDAQLALFHTAEHCKRYHFRDVDPVSQSFLPLPGRGRRSQQAPAAPLNALEGGNYFRNLYSLMLGYDVSHGAFHQWLSGEELPPRLGVEQLSSWLRITGAQITVWEHRGNGAHILGPAVAESRLRPRILHLGVREGSFYQLLIDGPWHVKFGGGQEDDTAFALEHGVPTKKCYRHMAETVGIVEAPAEPEDCEGQVYNLVDEVEKALDARQRTLEGDRRTVKAKESTETWFFSGCAGLRHLATQLHFRGYTCEAKLSSFSNWTLLIFPGLGIKVRSWCPASMGGLHPDDITAVRANELTRAFGQHLTRLSSAVLNFRVASQYSPSLQTLLERFCRGPIVGAEHSEGAVYDAFDMQCDINAAHPAAMLAIKTVPAFCHFDEVQAYDGHEIEENSMYIVVLNECAGATELDAFLNADVTPVLGSSYLKYLELMQGVGRKPVPHSITHHVKPSRLIKNCHVPHVVQGFLDEDMEGHSASVAQKLKKGVLVTLSGLLQQRSSDRISAIIVSGEAETEGLGDRVVPVYAEMEAAVGQMREGGEVVGEMLAQDAHVCMKWRRYWYKDGFFALALHILEHVRLQVLEIRNALESCGASDFAYMCDAVFYKGDSVAENILRQRFPTLFGSDKEGNVFKKPGTVKFKPAHEGVGQRTFNPIQLKRSLDELPFALRHIDMPERGVVSVRPLWAGLGTSFASLQAAEEAWRCVSMQSKRRQWDDICAAESPATLRQLLQVHLQALAVTGQQLRVGITGQHGGVGKSYCGYRAATKMFKSGLILTPTNSLRTAYTAETLPEGWVVRTYDRQFGFFLGEELQLQKTKGSLGLARVGCVILEEVAYVPLRALSMVLAAADHAGAHVIATYDVHQLDSIEGSGGAAGYSVSVDNIADRLLLLQQVFPISYHIFARKRDRTKEEQVQMDDHLLYVLGAVDDSDARRRVMERFGSSSAPSRAAFHLAYTRECARFHAFQELLRSSSDAHTGDVSQLRQGAQVVAGKYHKFSGGAGVVHKNHMYQVSAVTSSSTMVESAFDRGQSLPAVQLPLSLAEVLFDPPGGSTVHAVQGRTVHGSLIVHQVGHARVTKQWLYTAVSRGCGASNVHALADRHVSRSDMTEHERRRWVGQKAAGLLQWDKNEKRAVRSTARQLTEYLLKAPELCELCHEPFVWALYSERQPTLDRLDNTIGHDCSNLAITCLRCNRERGARSLRKKRKKADVRRGVGTPLEAWLAGGNHPDN